MGQYVRLCDLDPATRKRVSAAAAAGGTAVKRSLPPRTASGKLGRDLNRYRCLTCGREGYGFVAAERHVNTEHGGGTIRLVLDPSIRGD